MNGDGKPDLVVTNWCPDNTCSDTKAANGTVGVLLGKGNGTFEPVVTYDSGGGHASSVSIADVSGDKKPDLIVANGCQYTNVCPADQSVGVMLGNGDGTFQSVVTYGSGGFFTNSVTVADVNGDGKLDLVAGNACSSVPCTNTDSTVGVLLGNGNGTFQSAVPHDSGGQVGSAVTVADVNGDGKLDLVTSGCGDTSSCMNDVGIVLVLQGNGDGTFQPAVSYFAGPTFQGASGARGRFERGW